MRPWNTAQRWAFAGIVALAALLRFYTLGSQPFWSDEWYTLKMSQQPHWIQTVLMTLVTDLYPPLLFVLTRASLAFGDGLVQMRFFSFLGGVAAVALVFVIARRWWGTRAAVYAGLLAAVSPMGVYYAQEYKLYSFFAATNLWFLYECLRTLDPEQPVRNPWRLAAATAVSMYTYYLAPYLLAPLYLAAAWAWWRGRKAEGLTALKGMSYGLLLALPLFPFFLKTIMIFSANFWDLGRHALLWTTLQTYSDGIVAPAPVAQAAALLFACLVALNLRQRGPQTWAAAAVVAFATVPSLLQFLQTELLKPSYSDRAMLGAAYGWTLAAGLGLAAVDRWLAMALLAVALSFNAHALKLHYDPATRSRYDFQASYEALKKDWRPGDAVIHNDQQSLFPFNYYQRHDRSGLISYEKTEDPGFHYNEAVGRGREAWRKINAWLKTHDLGIDSGIDPYRVFGERLDKVAVGDAKRLWYVVPSVEVLSRCWNPMLNLWRNHYVAHQPFDPTKEPWLAQKGFKLKSKHELSPGVDAYLFERK